jgi:hypothetical protein
MIAVSIASIAESSEIPRGSGSPNLGPRWERSAAQIQRKSLPFKTSFTAEKNFLKLSSSEGSMPFSTNLSKELTRRGITSKPVP